MIPRRLGTNAELRADGQAFQHDSALVCVAGHYPCWSCDYRVTWREHRQNGPPKVGDRGRRSREARRAG